MSGDTAHKGIIWLASYPKSGNTWLRNVLHNLAAVMGAGEDGAGAPRGFDRDGQDINALDAWSTVATGAKRFEAVLGKTIGETSLAEIAAVRHAVQARIADEADGAALVKTHSAVVMDHGHATLNFDVTAGAIYVVRNPLDVAISLSHHMNCSLDEAIEQMADSESLTEFTERSTPELVGSWRLHVQSWTAKPHPTILVMRYEDMLATPEAAFGALARHLHWRPTPGQLREAIELSSFERLRAQEEKAGFREKPEAAERFFREGRAGPGSGVTS